MPKVKTSAPTPEGQLRNILAVHAEIDKVRERIRVLKYQAKKERESLAISEARRDQLGIEAREGLKLFAAGKSVGKGAAK